MEGESDWPCRSHTYPEQGFRSSRERSIWELLLKLISAGTMGWTGTMAKELPTCQRHILGAAWTKLC